MEDRDADRDTAKESHRPLVPAISPLRSNVPDRVASRRATGTSPSERANANKNGHAAPTT